MRDDRRGCVVLRQQRPPLRDQHGRDDEAKRLAAGEGDRERHVRLAQSDGVREQSPAVAVEDRSEERRVGKECRSRWSPYHLKKKKKVMKKARVARVDRYRIALGAERIHKRRRSHGVILTDTVS